MPPCWIFWISSAFSNKRKYIDILPCLARRVLGYNTRHDSSFSGTLKEAHPSRAGFRCCKHRPARPSEYLGRLSCRPFAFPMVSFLPQLVVESRHVASEQDTVVGDLDYGYTCVLILAFRPAIQWPDCGPIHSELGCCTDMATRQAQA